MLTYLKKVFIFINLCLIFCLGNSYYACSDDIGDYDAYYKLTYSEEKEAGLMVELQFKGNSDGSSILYIPIFSPARASNPDNQFDVTANQGIVTLHEDNEEKIEECANGGKIYSKEMYCKKVRIKYIPSTELTIRYTIPNWVNALISKAQGSLLAGEAIFLLPEPKDKQDLAIEIDWSGLGVQQAKIITPDSVKNNTQVLKANMDELFRSWYYFGDSDVLATETTTYPKLNIITIGSPETKLNNRLFSHGNLVDLSTRIATNNQKFIDGITNRSNPKKQSIVIFNSGVKAIMNGYAQENFYVIRAPLEDDYRQADLADTISHEYLHQLFGHNLRAGFGPSSYITDYPLWFSEGFTYYYAPLLNLKGKIITLDEYLKIFNDEIRKYYTQFISLQSIAINIKQCAPINIESEGSGEVGKRVGQLVASNLDNLIQIKTHGKYQLKDLLKNAVSSCESLPCKLSKEQFVTAYGNLIDDQERGKWVSNYLTVYIEDFNIVKLLDPILEKKLGLSYKTFSDAVDIGFDYQQTVCTGVVSGVDRKSRAYRAGVRNGDKLSFLETNFDNGSMDIKMTIEEEKGTSKVIAFKCIGEVKVPQYSRLSHKLKGN